MQPSVPAAKHKLACAEVPLLSKTRTESVILNWSANRPSGTCTTRLLECERDTINGVNDRPHPYENATSYVRLVAGLSTSNQ